MLKYKLLAIENGNDEAVISLGKYYDGMGNIDAMCDLAIGYKNQKKYDIMLKFLNVARNHGSVKAVRLAAKYYILIGRMDLTEKCYLVGIEDGCTQCMYGLAKCYHDARNYKKMLEFYAMYVNNVKIHKINEIMSMCRSNSRYGKEFAQLYDICLNIWDTKTTDECSICLDGYGKYQTKCCEQYGHYACLIACKSCPFCRSDKFL